MDENKELLKQIEIAELPEKQNLQLELAFQKRTSDPQFSFELAMSVYQDAVKFQLPELELKALHEICNISHNYQTETGLLKWIDLLIQRGLELENNQAVGRAYIHKYRISRKDGKYTEAAQYLTKALEFLNPEQHSQDVSSCYNGLGNIYQKLNNLDKAYEYYQKALPLVKDSRPDNYFILLQNIGTIHVLKKDYAKAWDIFHDLMLKVPEKEIVLRTLILLNLGNICHITNQLTEAVIYIQEALELKLANGIEQDIIRNICALVTIYIELNEPEKALEYLQKAKEIAPQKEIIEQITFYETSIKYYKLTDNLQNLVVHYEKLLTAKAQFNEVDNLKQIDEFEAQHQINLYKEKSLMLEERNTLFAEQNEKLQATMEKLITKDKELEIELRSAFNTINKKDDLLAAHHRLASIGEMIAIIAHQWKQPLNIINSMVFSIKDAYHFNELTEDFINEKAKMIDDLIQYLSQTMNDFRNFFKEQNNIDFMASDAIKGTVSLLSYALDIENVSVKTDLKKDFALHGSQNELIQVFLNLINNARDAFKEENIPQPVIKISLEKKPEHYLVSFYNNGGPIPEELSDKIFEAYVSSKGEKGTGLGLNICQTIIEDRFKGKIYFQNTQEGVTFYIELPLKKK